MQEFHRTDRIASELRRALPNVLKKLQQTPPGLLTIQEVRVSSDLAHAKVFFTVLGADDKQVLKILEQNASFLRHALSQVMRLRIVPVLRFVLDCTLEEGNRLQALIEAANVPQSHSEKLMDDD